MLIYHCKSMLSKILAKMPCILALFLTALALASTTSAKTLRSRAEPRAQVVTLPSWPWVAPQVYSTNPQQFQPWTIAAIKYESGKQLTNDIIWAIGDVVVWKLKWDTTNWGGWVPDLSWGSQGRNLEEKLDAAGITFGSSTLTAYFSTERIFDGSSGGVSRLAICQFSTRAPEAAGNPLKIDRVWDLSKVLNASTSQVSGLEGLTFVPDSYLQANLFQTSPGKYYNPKDYPNRVDNGVFFTAYQDDGKIYAFLLYNDNKVDSILSFQAKNETNVKSSLLDLEFDPNTGYLWTFSEDRTVYSSGQSSLSYQHRVFTISNGTFTQKAKFSPPVKFSEEVIVRGFTIEPESRCDSFTNSKYAYWTNDKGGFLYRTQIKCGKDARLPDLYPQPVVSPNPFNATV
jgi:hypothetical protein